ncbi:hypothetical protein [Ectobacillus ponti]|uniref:Uncharacterized protein n=1 Tax=Ectobacillus ponti TaxID=2961894 RepID=A0AA42BQL3_9BACI|nr:hypothetical protein [Ectobacillus ponti]MCP8968574.1 hypothetical protein [Ectobacillus ponti]
MSRLEKQVSGKAKLSNKTVKSRVMYSRQNRTDSEFAREMSRTMQRDQLIELTKANNDEHK